MLYEEPEVITRHSIINDLGEFNKDDKPLKKGARIG